MDKQQPNYELMKTRGWAGQYLIQGDNVFGSGRLAWWAEALMTRKLPAAPIPQIDFQEAGSNRLKGGIPVIPKEGKNKNGPPLTAAGARHHLDDLIGAMGGGWDALAYLLDWLSWSLGVGDTAELPMPRYEQKWHEYLYLKFELGRLQAAEADVLGAILSERHGNGWNPHAFYPTPQGVCKMMTRITMANSTDTEGLADGHDPRLRTVCDPCVGTGRFLLEASNYSVDLSGMDIDRMCVNACSINMALYAPWAVYLPSTARDIMRRPRIEEADALAACMNDIRVERGYADAVPKDSGYKFNRHGQGDLFSVLEREN